jgi:opacity protein-like surface antigen
MNTTTVLVLSMMAIGASAAAQSKEAESPPAHVADAAASPETAAMVSPTEATVTEIQAVEVTPANSPAEATPIGGEPKPADANLGLSVAAKLGGTLPTSPLGLTYFVGAEVGYRLPVLDRLLGVAFEFSAGEPKKAGNVTATAAGGDFKYDLSQRLLILAFDANAQYTLAGLSVYGGAGYGVYVLKATTKAFGQTNSETQTRAGTQLRAGVAYRLGPGDVFAEARYHYVGLRFLATGRSNAGGVTLGIGYRFGF